MSKKQDIVRGIGLFVLAMVVSALFWSFLPGEFRSNQSTDYLNHYEPVARSIAAGQGVTLNGTIATRYPPGFSILLAGVFRLGEWLNVEANVMLLAFRLFCVGLSVVFVYALARLIWSSNLSLIPALAWLTYPFALWLNKQPNSEVPFIPILYAGLFVFWFAILRKPRAWWLYFLAGMLAGVAMLIRPSAVGLGGVMAALALVTGGHGKALRARVLAALLLLTGNVLMVLPWEAAVFAQTREVIPLSSGGTITIQDGLTFLAVPKAYRREVDIPEDVAALMLEFQARRSEMGTMGEVLTVTIDEARQAPVAFAKLMLIKTARSWYGIDSRQFELPTILLQIVYLGLVLWGSLYAIRRGGDLRLLIGGNWIIVLYFWAMTILVIPLFRYMLPVMGLVMIALPGVWLSLKTRRAGRVVSVTRPYQSDY